MASTASTWQASAWRILDQRGQRVKQRVLTRMNGFNKGHGTEFPIFKKTDKIRWLSQVSLFRWIVTHSAWPIMIHNLWNYSVGRYFGRMPHLFAFGLYAIASAINMGREINCLTGLARECGFLDGDVHARDKVPENGGFTKSFSGAIGIIVTRAAMTVGLSYRKADTVFFSPWIAAELLFYPIVLDFFFYAYHRATHEIDGLWKYHRTHHLTKHPNPGLSAYADVEQDVIEMAIVPLLTYLTLKSFGFPMPFCDWWLCQSFTFFSEAFGHSGLRALMMPPGLASPLLQIVGCELVLEDHDLHHRQGWRKSGNYGKATRVWDRLFGTCLGRIESKWENVDYEEPLYMWWW